MHDGTLVSALAALLQVVLVDLTLAADNAVVVGMAVSGLPQRQQRRAIVLGIAGATVMRIALSAITLRLLAVVGVLPRPWRDALYDAFARRRQRIAQRFRLTCTLPTASERRRFLA